MSEALAIRTAGAGDLAALLALYAELNPSDPPVEPAIAKKQMDAILAQPGMQIFIGFSGEEAAATVTLSVIPNLTRAGAPYALIENVVTLSANRKKGYGAALIAHAIETAWQAGCYKVMLLTGSKTPATLRFYENCGFTQDKTGYQVRRPAGR
ncbi:GNAT family N-acetyltransferase [Rhizobium sp. Rhizsp82]|uniref:GNAT family N-acetyltransferase n=1 Tax=Rhizobium sp. Rhizsp82 TaxID=3243057 RepID=UPI0039B48DE9